MKIRILAPMFAILMTLPSLSALAAGNTVKVAVNGMVCSFCAQGIKKKFQANESVKAIDVAFGAEAEGGKKENIVSLELKDGKELSDAQINDLISSAGYSVERIER